MLKDVFKPKTKYATLPVPDDSLYRAAMPGRCPNCNVRWDEQFLENFLVCPECDHHQPMTVEQRLVLIADADNFVEYDAGMTSLDPLDFPGYKEKLKRAQESTGLKEAIVTGIARINGWETVLGIMDGRFMMASMGSVVGEKITRAFERAMELKLPVIIFTASGGARMQEGMISLMQMAKTSAAVGRFAREGLLYVSVLTHPTIGGVTASFATLADIILAEPGATVGFTGARVIEQTLHQKLPPEFQKSEFLLEHGMIDRIVHRHELKAILAKILAIHQRS